MGRTLEVLMDATVDGKADAWGQPINAQRMPSETNRRRSTRPSRHTVRVKMNFLFHIEKQIN
jgi:hypothetical protein